MSSLHCVLLPSLDSPILDLAQAPATTVDLDTSLVLDLGLATMDLALTQTTTLDLAQLLETLPDLVLVLATSLDLVLTQMTTLDLAQDLALGENI